MTKKEKYKVKINEYLYVEVARDAVDEIIKSCSTISELQNGNLNPIVEYVSKAYQHRTGNQMSMEMLHQVKDCMHGIEAIGWNKPVEHTEHINESADLNLDICNALQHQIDILHNGIEPNEAMERYRKDVPFVRTINAIWVNQGRRKPLRAFVTNYSSKRRR